MKTPRLAAFLLFCCFWAQSEPLFAQKMHRPSANTTEVLPHWVQLMYQADPNVWHVDSAYRAYYRTQPFSKTTHTQYYKKWRRAAMPNIDRQGYIRPIGEEQRVQQIAARREMLVQQRMQGVQSGNWQLVGPVETFSDEGLNYRPKSEQANVYCLDQSKSNPNTLYCATEGAEIFKTTDRGLNWQPVSWGYPIGAPTAIKIHPNLSQTVYAADYDHVYKTVDGGVTWNTVLTESALDPATIFIHPSTPQRIWVAGWKGLYYSSNGGNSWTPVYTQPCYDMLAKPNDPNTIYLLKGNTAQERCEFFKSTDAGATFNLTGTGWYNSTDPTRNDDGGRLAVSDADPNRIYAVLIGQAKDGDSGFIGIYRSNDAGNSWTLPNPPTGGPYNATTHPNLATFDPSGGTYHQGFYNLAIDASDSNADQLLIGFLNLWQSNDGAASFVWVGGYGGFSTNYVHPDIQSIQINGNEIWFSSDGGVNYSTDFLQSHEARNKGISSADYWGFGAGWNEDVLVGGRYHNGNAAYHENYPYGQFMGMGGGEASTGYVNPGNNRDTYHSDIGGRRIPTTLDGTLQNIPMGMFPNEGYYPAESSEMEFDPRCYGIVYLGKDNSLWKSSNNGNTFDLVYTFGTDAAAYLTQIEISRANPNTIYVFQRNAATWSEGTLWKTSDAGVSWNPLSLPTGYKRRLVITHDFSDPNTLWIAYTDGADGQKVFKSINGGTSWTNLSTATLNGHSIQAVMHQAGTNGGIYVASQTTVFYRNNALTDWVVFADGLPVSISTDILKPFYRDGKIRLAAYGKGIWESDFYEPSTPVAQPMVNATTSNCANNLFYFEDYSAVSHNGATWNWQFEGGTPASSTLRNPQVHYANPGVYDVTLTVTAPNGASTKILSNFITILPATINAIPLVEDFNDTNYNVSLINPDNGTTWQAITINNCNGNNTAWYLNCYTYGSTGQTDDIALPDNLDLTNATTPFLRFRAAYSPYIDSGGSFIDSLHVLVSTDCGASFHVIYRSGGEALSTNSNGIGTNNLYSYDPFTPENCNEWRNICIDLGDYIGQVISLRLRGINGYGNNIYIDDIILENNPLLAPNVSGAATVCANSIQTYTAPVGTATTQYVWTVTGGTIVSGQGTSTVLVQWTGATIGTLQLQITP